MVVPELVLALVLDDVLLLAGNEVVWHRRDTVGWEGALGPECPVGHAAAEQLVHALDGDSLGLGDPEVGEDAIQSASKQRGAARSSQGGHTAEGKEQEAAPCLHAAGDHVGERLRASELPVSDTFSLNKSKTHVPKPLAAGHVSSSQGAQADGEDLGADDPRQAVTTEGPPGPVSRAELVSDVAITLLT